MLGKKLTQEMAGFFVEKVEEQACPKGLIISIRSRFGIQKRLIVEYCDLGMELVSVIVKSGRGEVHQDLTLMFAEIEEHCCPSSPSTLGTIISVDDPLKRRIGFSCSCCGKSWMTDITTLRNWDDCRRSALQSSQLRSNVATYILTPMATLPLEWDSYMERHDTCDLWKIVVGVQGDLLDAGNRSSDIGVASKVD